MYIHTIRGRRFQKKATGKHTHRENREREAAPAKRENKKTGRGERQRKKVLVCGGEVFKPSSITNHIKKSITLSFVAQW
jgi:hypothetical protein